VLIRKVIKAYEVPFGLVGTEKMEKVSTKKAYIQPIS
jgi:hypothetical protein